MSRAARVALLLLSCACRESADVTQTIVLLDADPAAQDAMSRVRVEAVGPDGDPQPAIETTDPGWPVKLVLAPKDDDASRRFTLHVETYDAKDARSMRLQFRTGFVEGQSRYVKLQIAAACVQTCEGEDDACNSWSVELNASELGRSAAAPRTIEAPCRSVTPPQPMSNAGAGGAGGTAPTAGTMANAGAGGAPLQPSGPCGPGYEQTATGCADIDDCASQNPCGPHGQCRNIPGNYLCQCDTGYQNQAGTCIPSGDCQTNNGGCEATCEDSSGFVTCTCPDGEWIRADRKSCGRFGDVRRLDRTGSTEPTQPHVAFDAEGNALAVWTQTELTPMGALTTSLWTRAYVTGKGWDPMPHKLSIMAAGAPRAPKVALPAKGPGVVVWTQIEGGEGDIWAVQIDGKAHGEPARIDAENTGSAYEPSVMLGDNGDGFAAWNQTDGSESQLWVNRFTASEGWDKPEEIETPSRSGNGNGNGNGNGTMPDWGNWGNWGSWAQTGGGFGVRLALDADGNASVAWSELEFASMGVPSVSPWCARFDLAAEEWHSAVELDESGAAATPDNYLFGDGLGVAVWARLTDNRISLRSSHRGRGGNWSDSIDVATFDSDFTAVMPRVAVSPSGSGAAIWTQYRAPTAEVWATRYDGAADQWSDATRLGTLDTTIQPQPRLAVDPSGDGFAVWSEVRGAAREIKLARLHSETGFSTSTTLATSGAAPVQSPAQIAVDPQGRAIAIWETFEMGQYGVSAAVFE